MIEQHDKCSLHEIENIITSLKGIFEEKKPRQKTNKKNKKQKTNNTKQNNKKKKEKDTEIGEFLTLGFDSIKS